VFSVKKGTIFSAMRPTGRLHLGNYEGALRNWVALQDDYTMYCGIVDLHALTTDYADTASMRDNILQLAVDYVSAGIDPERTPIIVQSQVKQHSELHLLLSMVTPVSWLERVPTYKEKVDNLKGEAPGYGLLGYPVLMAADILLYKADTVPVGQDQLPHVELTREIARRFNNFYGPVLPEPQAKVTPFAALPGLDGRKMSKSYDNTIELADEPETIRRKVSTMFTDPARIHKTDPGHPDGCPVHMYHRVYNAPGAEELAEACRAGQIGCVECKQRLAEALIEALAPIRDRRKALEADPARVEAILREGAERARAVAACTVEEVMAAMALAPAPSEPVSSS